MLRMSLLVTVFSSVMTAAPPDQAMHSTALAKQLSVALTAKSLEAIAAAHPDDPNRFVAALFFPGAQLLVVAADYPAPALLQSKLSKQQYREIYLDLQASPASESSWFVQDMKADGLCAAPDQTADVVYAGRQAPTVFDGDWKKHAASEEAYDQKLSAADERYSRLLELLLSQLTTTT
jgi:hypothetical protein